MSEGEKDKGEVAAAIESPAEVEAALVEPVEPVEDAETVEESDGPWAEAEGPDAAEELDTEKVETPVASPKPSGLTARSPPITLASGGDGVGLVGDGQGGGGVEQDAIASGGGLIVGPGGDLAGHDAADDGR